MTSGRAFAMVAAIAAMLGVVTAVIGQLQRDGYVIGGGGSVILFSLVYALLSFRDFR